MGQARTKLLKEGERVDLDLSAPDLFILQADRRVLSARENDKPDERLAVPRAVKTVIMQVIQAAFPQGMDRKDGKVWAAWLELLDDNDVVIVEVARGMLEWLRKHLANDDVRTIPALAQWREAVLDYVEGLLKGETNAADGGR